MPRIPSPAECYRDDLRRPGTRSLSMTSLGEGLLDVRDPPVKVLFVYASNPLASVPNQSKIQRGLQRPDLFTVVAEHFRTDTVEYADIVLPATMQLEHADLQISYGHLYISWNEPAVSPPGECLPSTEIFRRLARRMGLDISCLYASDDEIAHQVLDSGHSSLHGITLDRLKERGWMRLNYPAPFVPFADGFFTASGKLEVPLRAHGEGGTGSAGRLHSTVRGRPAGHPARRTVPPGVDRGSGPLLSELAVRQRR